MMIETLLDGKTCEIYSPLRWAFSCPKYPMRIKCYTTIDITETGIKHVSQNSSPEQRTRRNQQRNWETFIQVISLRTHVEILSKPTISQEKSTPEVNVFEFEFLVESDDVFATADNQLGLLIAEAENIPVIPIHESAPSAIKTTQNENTIFELQL